MTTRRKDAPQHPLRRADHEDISRDVRRRDGAAAAVGRIVVHEARGLVDDLGERHALLDHVRAIGPLARWAGVLGVALGNGRVFREVYAWAWKVNEGL